MWFPSLFGGKADLKPEPNPNTSLLVPLATKIDGHVTTTVWPFDEAYIVSWDNWDFSMTLHTSPYLFYSEEQLTFLALELAKREMDPEHEEKAARFLTWQDQVALWDGCAYQLGGKIDTARLGINEVGEVCRRRKDGTLTPPIPAFDGSSSFLHRLGDYVLQMSGATDIKVYRKAFLELGIAYVNFDLYFDGFYRENRAVFKATETTDHFRQNAITATVQEVPPSTPTQPLQPRMIPQGTPHATFLGYASNRGERPVTPPPPGVDPVQFYKEKCTSERKMRYAAEKERSDLCSATEKQAQALLVAAKAQDKSADAAQKVANTADKIANHSIKQAEDFKKERDVMSHQIKNLKKALDDNEKEKEEHATKPFTSANHNKPSHDPAVLSSNGAASHTPRKSTTTAGPKPSDKKPAQVSALTFETGDRIQVNANHKHGGKTGEVVTKPAAKNDHRAVFGRFHYQNQAYIHSKN